MVTSEVAFRPGHGENSCGWTAACFWLLTSDRASHEDRLLIPEVRLITPCLSAITLFDFILFNSITHFIYV